MNEKESIVSQHPQQVLTTIARKVRLWPEIPHDRVVLPPVPAVQTHNGATMLVTSLLSMGGVLVSAVLFAKFSTGSQGIFFIAFLAMSVFATLASLVSYVIQTLSTRRQRKYLIHAYKDRLAECEKELQALQWKERQAHVDLNPPLLITEANASVYEHLSVVPLIQRSLNDQDMYLWVRRPDDPDFLTARIGTGRCATTFSIHSEESKHIALPDAFDELRSQAHTLQNSYSSLLAPVTVKLAEHGPVTIACTQQRLTQARELLHSMVAQTAYHHSPEDVRILILAPRSQEAQWQWASLLPHTLMIDAGLADEQHVGPMHMVAIGPEAIVEQLSIISRELSRRELQIGDERRTPVSIFPRLVIVVDHFDAQTDFDHAPSSMPVMIWQSTSTKVTRSLLTVSPLKRAEMTLALMHSTRLGVSVITACASPGDIPTTSDTLIDMREPLSTTATTKSLTEMSVHTLRPDPPPSQVCDLPDGAPLEALRYFASKLQSLRPAATKRPQIRMKVDMRMLFDPALDLATYNPIHMWSNATLRSTPAGDSAPLRIPIGQRIGDELQYLDLMRDGPHGLLIGQTGSGKSELLQTIITMLATLYRPSEVTFLLIDYKAGLALEPFRRLPHTIGFLSNVSSPALIQRFITMLRAEAIRREVKLKKGESSPPLVIVIDEFAEMVKRTETVLDELFTITRVGRELGMHLLLAAQRPEGIIGSKVRDYVQYRLCLRCASPEDSREVLGRVDAANLPASIPGRGYLLHGDNQLDLFQAARASVPLKSRQIATNAASGGKQQQKTSSSVARDIKSQTVAQSVIDAIAGVYSHEQARSDGISFWPDPLPVPVPTFSPDPLVLFKPGTSLPAITTTSIAQSEEPRGRFSLIQQTLREAAQQRQMHKLDAHPMRIPLGFADIPDEQRRSILWLDLHGEVGTLKGGPLLLAGGQSSGKGVALQTILLWLLTQYTSRQFRYAIIDAGHDLEHFQQTPYTCEENGVLLWTNGENEEQVIAVVDGFMQQVARRREQYPGMRWDEHTLGRLRAQGADVPAYLMIINNYHTFVDNFKVNDKLKKFILNVASLRTMGFYLILTSAELGRFVPAEVIGKMGTRIGLFLNDQQRYELFGRNTTPLEPIPGRGYVLTRDRIMHEVQLALPLPGATEHLRYEALKQEIDWLCTL